MRDGNDVAADRVGLEDVEQFARARPKQFRFRALAQDLHRFLHQRHRINTAVGNPAGAAIAGDGGGVKLATSGSLGGLMLLWEFATAIAWTWYVLFGTVICFSVGYVVSLIKPATVATVATENVAE